jgi:hypothetical protein
MGFALGRNAIAVVLVSLVAYALVTVANEKASSGARESAARVEREKGASQEAQAAEEQKKLDQLPLDAKSRVAFAKLIQAAFQADGRLIGVAATGENFDTLELSSGLIMAGSYTLDAAREIYGSDTLKMLKHLKFKCILLKGTELGYSESVLLK